MIHQRSALDKLRLKACKASKNQVAEDCEERKAPKITALPPIAAEP